VLTVAFCGIWADSSRAASPTVEASASAVVLPSPTERAEKYFKAALRFDLLGDAKGRDMMFDWAHRVAPNYGPANWLSGRVECEGGYCTVEESIRRLKEQGLGEQYRELRDEHLKTVAGELKLARWCARNGQQDLATFHYRRLAANPRADAATRSEAGRRLGLELYHGRWLTHDEIEAQQRLEKQLRAAFEKWGPKLRDWQAIGVSDKNQTKVERALEEIAAIDDPTIVPVADVFVKRLTSPVSDAVVEMLGRFPQFEATEALAHYAIGSPQAETRAAATKLLESRPLHEFVPLLLDALVAPVQTRWRVRFDNAGNVLYQHLYFQQGQDGNVLLRTDHSMRPATVTMERVQRVDRPGGLVEGPLVDTDLGERAGLAIAVAGQAARQHERRQQMVNARTGVNNMYVFGVLEATTAGPRNRNVAQWWDWWQDYNQTRKPRPTCYLYRASQETYAVNETRRATVGRPAAVGRQMSLQMRHSCFPAGTTVWTDHGPAAIETIQIGDRVLSQDVDSGELAWKPVLRTTAGAPTADLMCLTVKGEEICPTKGHVVWESGAGWRIADRIEEGERIHTLHGSRPVESRREEPAPATVYNLVVQDFDTYFVGRAAILVHDITERTPTRSIVPGLVGR
jgi:hypothetical protein